MASQNIVNFFLGHPVFFPNSPSALFFFISLKRDVNFQINS